MEGKMPIIKIPEDLKHDCENCQGLCCYAFSQKPRGRFPIKIEKPQGVPCPHLAITPQEGELYHCKIHDRLTEEGWKPCVEYSCHGAGQAISMFFKELGVSWAEQKPEKYTDKQWEVLKQNQILGFQVLQGIFDEIHRIKENLGPEKYEIARRVFSEVARGFSIALTDTENEIDADFWLHNRFWDQIAQAVYSK